MGRGKFRAVVKGIVTEDENVLIGKKEETEGHPISGQWHLMGGHLEHGETLEQAIKREIKEEANFDVEVYELVESSTFAWSENDELNSIQFVFHCKPNGGTAKAKEDLEEIKWVAADQIINKLGSKEANRVKRSQKQSRFFSELN